MHLPVGRKSLRPAIVKGYWQDLPLTNLITRHAENDAVAIIDGERQISYRQFNQLVDNLACSLQRRGLKRGRPRWCSWAMSPSFT
nr:hypothetical protein [Klebsiella pneumoniae subsp. pneumoniae]